eukprot:Pgem_evm1s262
METVTPQGCDKTPKQKNYQKTKWQQQLHFKTTKKTDDQKTYIVISQPTGSWAVGVETLVDTVLNIGTWKFTWR